MISRAEMLWLVGGTPCSASSCDMISQFSPIYPTTVTASNLLTSTVSFVATTPGTTSLTWVTTGGFRLDFFGLTDAPGSSLTVVPEPGTGLLLFVGCLALAARSRRRLALAR